MLANQRGAKLAPKPPAAAVPPPPPVPEPQFSGSGEQGLYTVKDVGKGISKGWSKLRGRSASRESREAASAGGAATPKAQAEPPRNAMLADVAEEPDGGKTPRRSSLTPVHSRRPEDEEEDTAPVRRAASMGPPSGHADPNAKAAHDRAVFGYDPVAIRDALLGAVGLGGSTDAEEPARGRNADVVGTNATPVQSRRSSPKPGEERFEREVWRGAARGAEESSSSGGDEDSATEDEGFESAGEDTTDDETADLEHARSTAAAGIELFDRHR